MKPAMRTLLIGATASAIVVPLAVALPAAGRQHSSVTKATSGAERCRLPGPYELPHGREHVQLRPSDFTTRIDNPYWPMRPGTTWVYREAGSGSTARVKVTVTHRTRKAGGVRARVVHDVLRENGRVVEDTFDLYAQDSGGSVWYLGENTKEFHHGQVSTEGSWRYGVDGAEAGVLIPARPRPGCRYRQEQYRDDAADRGAILSLRESVKVPAGWFRRVLTTGDRTPLEPKVLEHKFYGRHIGPVMELGVSPRAERTVLLRVDRPRG